MPHVTFVHGIANKPPRDALLLLWQRALENGDPPLRLGTHGITSEMVYWADVLYHEPLPEDDDLEAAETEAGVASREAAAAGAELELEALDDEERAFVLQLAAKLHVALGVEETAEGAQAPVEEALERIPLPWFVKRRLMKVLLRDVHHYLFDVEHRGVRVQREIRRRFREALELGAAQSPPHVVVSHSMGTVIAYDCLQRVSGGTRVDGLMTIGSPLGLDEIQDRLKPEWSRDNGFPSRRLAGSWINVFDPLDPVAGLDPRFANDYRLRGERVVVDVQESNYGRWRHSIEKYFAGDRLRGHLRLLLGLPPP
jgi:hypothetical protein